MNLQKVKQKFGIIGNSPELNRAIEVAVQVATTNLTVLITGESGTGKEFFPQIIHSYSARKHGKYFAINCGAIPEGTIDSELFGHEKGSFTGSLADRKGYFEEAHNGTLFMDEMGELPLATQVRLLRVLETGEFIKVGSSKPQKSEVRLIAATNLNIPEAINKGTFREDLYYRLNTVPIAIPPLRQRKDDIYLLFLKFATDFSEKYQMPPINLLPEARTYLENYYWPGNIRQLKNVTEQISIIEQKREVNEEVLRNYLPERFQSSNMTPALYSKQSESTHDFHNEREILYKVLFDMKKDVDMLKQLVSTLTEQRSSHLPIPLSDNPLGSSNSNVVSIPEKQLSEIEKEPELSISKNEKELIISALRKNNGKKRAAAKDLGISERTLYRKLKEYSIDA